MKSLRLTITLLVIGTLVCLGSTFAQAAQSQADGAPMSNAKFAEAVIMALGIELPENAENLSEAELYEVQANILAERGIDIFVNSDPQSLVTKGDLCKLLQTLNESVEQATNTSSGRSSVTNPFYDPISGYVRTPPPEIAEQIEQLDCVANSESKETVSANIVISALNNPAYSDIVAEAYSSPQGIGRPPLNVPPQNPTPEDDPGLLLSEGPGSEV